VGITGKVIEDEVPVDNAIVTLVNVKDAVVATVRSAGGGNFAFNDVPDGAYRLKGIRPATKASGELAVVVKDPIPVKDVELKLVKKKARIAGTVTEGGRPDPVTKDRRIAHAGGGARRGGRRGAEDGRGGETVPRNSPAHGASTATPSAQPTTNHWSERHGGRSLQPPDKPGHDSDCDANEDEENHDPAPVDPALDGCLLAQQLVGPVHAALDLAEAFDDPRHKGLIGRLLPCAGRAQVTAGEQKPA
jgi:Carboxypeptidase regulatory-like domain